MVGCSRPVLAVVISIIYSFYFLGSYTISKIKRLRMGTRGVKIPKRDLIRNRACPTKNVFSIF